MSEKRTIYREISPKLIFIAVLLFVCSTTGAGQAKQSPSESDLPVPIVACESWINRVDQALDKWSANREATFIVIIRTDNSRISLRSNRKRIKTFKEYIAYRTRGDDKKISAIVAVSDRPESLLDDVVEIYIEGKLHDSLGLPTKSYIPLQYCNP